MITKMPFNDIFHIKQAILIGVSPSKFLLYGINVVYPSNNHKLLAALSTVANTNKGAMGLSAVCYCGTVKPVLSGHSEMDKT